jgi:membrane-bound lytic murein transglycosylase B
MNRHLNYLTRALFATLLIATSTHSAWATGIKHSKKPLKKAKTASVATTGPLYATRVDAMQAADAIAQRTGLSTDWVRQAIGHSHLMPSVVRAMAPAPIGMPKNWAVYRSRFIDSIRTAAGVKFWLANADALQRAQQDYGVPPEIIVGIVGVETIYGQQIGTYRVMDALTTLAFDFPQSHPRAKARSAYFLSELEAFLVLTQRTGTDPLALRGSYAGAMGLPQFMPSSWSKYAVDFDGDGRIDLFNSAADVIGSVANYFKSYGWQTGMPTHYTVQFNPAKLDMAALMAPDILPTFTPAAMADKGAELEADALLHPGLLALVELQNGAAPPQYVAGTANFYTITRYNWSSYYAMAVIELGQEVAAAMPK